MAHTIVDEFSIVYQEREDDICSILSTMMTLDEKAGLDFVNGKSSLDLFILNSRITKISKYQRFFLYWRDDYSFISLKAVFLGESIHEEVEAAGYTLREWCEGKHIYIPAPTDKFFDIIRRSWNVMNISEYQYEAS